MILGKPKEQSDLEKEIERVILYMSTAPPDSDEYKQIAKQLAVLHALKTNESPKPLDRNTVWTIGANLAGILLIVGYEQKHVVTSRALGMLRTLR